MPSRLAAIFIKLCFVVFLTTIAPAASALEYKGQLKSIGKGCFNIPKKASLHVKRLCIDSFAIKWKTGTLFGDPVENFVLQWKISPEIHLRGDNVNKPISPDRWGKKLQTAFSKVGIIEVTIASNIRTKATGRGYNNSTAGVKVYNVGALAPSGPKFSFNTAGSPAWDNFIHTGIGGCFAKANPMMKAAAAKAIYKTGFTLDSATICEVDWAGLTDLHNAIRELCYHKNGESTLTKPANAACFYNKKPAKKKRSVKMDDKMLASLEDVVAGKQETAKKSRSTGKQDSLGLDDILSADISREKNQEKRKIAAAKKRRKQAKVQKVQRAKAAQKAKNQTPRLTDPYKAVKWKIGKASYAYSSESNSNQMAGTIYARVTSGTGVKRGTLVRVGMIYKKYYHANSARLRQRELEFSISSTLFKKICNPGFWGGFDIISVKIDGRTIAPKKLNGGGLKYNFRSDEKRLNINIIKQGKKFQMPIVFVTQKSNRNRGGRCRKMVLSWDGTGFAAAVKQMDALRYKARKPGSSAPAFRLSRSKPAKVTSSAEAERRRKKNADYFKKQKARERAQNRRAAEQHKRNR